MGLAILGVLVLCFIALAIFSAKTWQIWHVLIVSALFVATFIFCAFAAATLKTQQRWRSQYEDSRDELELAQELEVLLTRGDPNSDEPSLGEIKGDVRRMLVDRGRVWRNLVLADVGEGTVTLDASNWGDEACQRVGLDSDGEFDDFEDEEPLEPIPEEGDAAEAVAGPAKPLGLQANAIVFAFQEAPIAGLPQPVQEVLFADHPLPRNDRKGLCRVPAFYLGGFKIMNDPQAEPTTIKLQPTLPPTDAQIEQFQNPDATWVLYEMLPIDSHEVFEGMTQEQMQLLIPPWGEVGDEAYSSLIDAYVRHNGRANDMDPPDRKWMRVKFTEETNLEVDVQEPTSLPDTSFDPSGRSISDNLRQNEQSKIRPNDEVLLDFATAQDFINQGVAEAIEPIYHRPLRDYERFFRNSAGALDSIGRQIAVAQEDLTKLDGANADLGKQITFFSEREQRLTEDRDGFNMERTVITEYRTALEQRWKDVLSELSRLYRANKQLVARMSSRLGDSVRRPDRRTLSSRVDVRP